MEALGFEETLKKGELKSFCRRLNLSSPNVAMQTEIIIIQTSIALF